MDPVYGGLCFLQQLWDPGMLQLTSKVEKKPSEDNKKGISVYMWRNVEMPV